MQLKVRCWFNGQMWHGIPSLQFNADGVARVDLNHDDSDFDPVPDTWTGREDYVLMLWTGAYDLEGREIYEGDILTNGSVVAPCVWCEEETGFVFDTPKLAHFPWDTLTVIGNMYETPGFLE